MARRQDDDQPRLAGGLAARWRAPDRLLGAVSWYLAVFGGGLLAVTAVLVVVADTPVSRRAVARVGIALAIAWVAWRYRRPRATLADVVPVAAALAVAYGTDRLLVPFLVLLVAGLFSALHAGVAATSAIAATAVAAFLGVVVVAGVEAGVLDVAAALVSLVAAAVLGQRVGAVLRRHEQEAGSEAVVNRAAADLQRHHERDEIAEVAVNAALDLGEDLDDPRSTLWRRDRDEFVVAASAPREDAPTLTTETIDGLMGRLDEGRPFLVSGEAAARITETLGAQTSEPPVYVVAPVKPAEQLTAVLALSGGGRPQAGVETALGRLAADVGLALERAENEGRFGPLLRGSSDVFAVTDDDLRLQYISPSAESVLGRVPDDLSGTPLGDLITGADRDRVLEWLTDEDLEPGSVLRCRVEHGDGTTREVELAASRAGDDEDAVVVNIRDVTDRVAAERRIHVSEERFRRLAENSRDGIYVLHFDPMHVEYVNPALARITGFPAESLQRDPAAAIREVAGADRKRFGTDRSRAPIGQDRPLELRLRRAAGNWVWVALQEAPIIDDRGRLIAVQGIVTDISHLKAEQEALQRALDQERVAIDEMRRLDELRTTFLAAVSHELRTPLTSVVGNATTLRRYGYRLPEDTRKELVGGIERNAHRLARLLTDLLDVDRLSRGLVSPQRVDVDLEALVRRAIEHVEVGTQALTLDLRPVRLGVDPLQIERVVVNLVTNAIKHTAAGTPIRVHLRPDEAGATLVVEDEGEGIPPELRDRIFEPFQQGPEVRDHHSPGTGIGLTLVARLVELHEGTVDIGESSSGGARFTVRLPAVEHSAG